VLNSSKFVKQQTNKQTNKLFECHTPITCSISYMQQSFTTPVTNITLVRNHFKRRQSGLHILQWLDTMSSMLSTCYQTNITYSSHNRDKHNFKRNHFKWRQSGLQILQWLDTEFGMLSTCYPAHITYGFRTCNKHNFNFENLTLILKYWTLFLIWNFNMTYTKVLKAFTWLWNWNNA